MVLIVEIGDDEVGIAVPVRVARVDSHPRLGHAGLVVGHFRLGGHVAKRSVSLVDQEKIRGSVAGNKKIRPSVVVYVDCDNTERPAGQPRQTRRGAYVGEMSVAIV